MSVILASIITIGDELLIGQTIDTNSAWIAQRFNEQGIDVCRRVAVGDIKEDIINALDAELTRSQIIVLTGGLGPTADDITKPLLKEYFGGSMRVDDRVLEHVTQLFTKRNRQLLERNLKQAEVPDSCTVLFNAMGTAPGMWFEKEGRVVISLPGVPFEMMNIIDAEVLPRLKEKFTGDTILHYTIITAGEGESFVAERIIDIEESLPEFIKLAYLPQLGMVKLRLTGKGRGLNILHETLQKYNEQIAQRLENIVVAKVDQPLEQLLHNWFTTHGAKLALAESCTGGNISHRITQIPGSSAYFMGSVVCYHNDTKVNVLGVNKETINQFGVISEPVVKEMAAGALARLNADYALAITGLLGPQTDDDTEPVGTVWMALASKNKIETKKFKFHYDRIRNKEMAVSMGLLMIYKLVMAETK